MTLEETVAFMKTNKILALRTPEGLEVSLDPTAFDEAPKTPAPEAAGGPNMDEVGSKGMTRQQQIDLLGQVFESDFKKRA